MTRILRTPDDRFENLPGYSFQPHYLDAGGIRIHYVDEGPSEGMPVLLLHGEPTWSYLYRKMIPIIASAGYRAIAPDLVGFGRSDKPENKSEYTYARHVDWMRQVIEQLDLSRITLFGQDWGGLIGLRLLAEHPDRFARTMASNTMLPTGDHPLGEAFHQWKEFVATHPEFEIGRVVAGGCARGVSEEIVRAYDAPFPSEEFKTGARMFPSLVPATPDDPASASNRAAWETLMKLDKPFLTAFGDSDPITRGGDRFLQAAIPGASGQAHTTIANAGHFIQEDAGEELAEILVRFASSS